MNYDHTAAKAYVKYIGMIWDEQFADRIDKIAGENGITQDQFDLMVREYSWRVKYMFIPTEYSWVQRIGIALHFLGVTDLFPDKG